MKVCLIIFLTIWRFSQSAIPNCETIPDTGPVRMCALFNNYSNNDYPTPQPCHILTKIKLLDIIKIDEIDQTIELIITLKKIWNDTRLTYKFNDINKPKEFPWIDIYSDDTISNIWSPNFLFFNSIQALKTQSQSDRRSFRYPHTNYEKIALNLKLSCELKFGKFPFDEHVCYLKFKNVRGPIELIKISPLIFWPREVMASPPRWFWCLADSLAQRHQSALSPLVAGPGSRQVAIHGPVESASCQAAGPTGR